MNAKSSYKIKRPMGVEKLKEVLHLRIEQGDENFLQIMYALAEAYFKTHSLPVDSREEAEIMAIPPSPAWKPLTKQELVAEIEEADAEIERGEFYTTEDLERDMEQW